MAEQPNPNLYVFNAQQKELIQKLEALSHNTRNMFTEIAKRQSPITGQLNEGLRRLFDDVQKTIKSGTGQASLGDAKDQIAKLSNALKDLPEAIQLLIKEEKSQSSLFRDFGKDISNVGRAVAGGKNLLSSVGRGDIVGAWGGIDNIMGMMDSQRSPFMGTAYRAAKGLSQFEPLRRMVDPDSILEKAGGVEAVAAKMAPKILTAVGGTLAVVGLAAAAVGMGYQLQKQNYQAGFSDIRSSIRYAGTSDMTGLYGGIVNGERKEGLRGGYLPLSNDQINAMMQSISAGSRRGGAQLYNLATYESVAQTAIGMGPGQFSGNIATLERRMGRSEDLTEAFAALTKFSKGGKQELGEFLSAVTDTTDSMLEMSPALRDMGKEVMQSTAEIIGFGQQAGMSAREAQSSYLSSLQRGMNSIKDPNQFFIEQFMLGKTLKEIVAPHTMSTERKMETYKTGVESFRQAYGTTWEPFVGREIGEQIGMQRMVERGYKQEAMLGSMKEGKYSYDELGSMGVMDEKVGSIIGKESEFMIREQSLRILATTSEAIDTMKTLDTLGQRFNATLMATTGKVEEFGKAIGAITPSNVRGGSSGGAPALKTH